MPVTGCKILRAAAKGAHCAEAWDCISRYIYTALQGGSIMRGWTNDERLMIACCNDGTRPVIFKIERQDYKVLYLDQAPGEEGKKRITEALLKLDGIERVSFREDKGFVEVFMARDVPDEEIRRAVGEAGREVSRID